MALSAPPPARASSSCPTAVAAAASVPDQLLGQLALQVPGLLQGGVTLLLKELLRLTQLSLLPSQQLADLGFSLFLGLFPPLVELAGPSLLPLAA